MARPTHQFRQFARVGAQARLHEIQAEIAALRREFPELRAVASVKSGSRVAAAAGTGTPAPPKRRTMSKAARAKIAAAQRARWARVRAAQKK